MYDIFEEECGQELSFVSSLKDIERAICSALSTNCVRTVSCNRSVYRVGFPIEKKAIIEKLWYKVVIFISRQEKQPFRAKMVCEDNICYIEVSIKYVSRTPLSVLPETVYDVIYKCTGSILDTFVYTEDVDVFRFDFDKNELPVLIEKEKEITDNIRNICMEPVWIDIGELQTENRRVASLVMRSLDACDKENI